MKVSPRGWNRLAVHRGLALIACLSLLAALYGPSLRAHRDVFNVLAVLDITQSMNVLDYQLNGKPASRLAFAKHALRAALPRLPCGSKLGLAVFSEHRTLVLITPVEVCRNRSELAKAIDAISGRMAWANESEISMGLYGALNTAAKLPDRPSLLFVTDGHEAPPVNPQLRPRFEGRPGDVHGVILGAGDQIPRLIPKIGPDGNPLGVWHADEVLQTDVYTHERAAHADSEEMADLGPPATPLPLDQPSGEEQLSALHERYLELLASETGLHYQRLMDVETLATVLTDPSTARREPASMEIRWAWGGLALLALVMLSIPQVSRSRGGREART